MDPYIELQFTASPRDEQIQSILYDYNPQGIVEEDDGTWKTYFTSAQWMESENELRSILAEQVPDAQYTVQRVEQQNWNALWEQSIEPVHVTPGIVITPSWSSYSPGKGEMVLVIDPKMSFGTGFHESTRLMLRLMERWVRSGDRTLDVGTGTGVLAIAAIKMGSSFAIGVDIDEWAEENANENIARNGVKGRVEIYIGSVERAHGTFDLILSNITRNDNIDLLASYQKLLNPGGRMILSGLYTHDLKAVSAACSDLGFHIVDEEAENEWIAAVYQR